MKRIFLLVVFLVSLSFGAAGQQSIEALQKQIADAKANIQATDALLSKTVADQKNNLSRLQLVRTNITNREKIVSSLDGQITIINRSVNTKASEVDRMEEELKKLKAEYAVMVRTTYKSQQSNNVLAFLFAAEDFNDITRRIFYIKRYTAIRERKAEQIDSISHALQADIAVLAVKRDSLDKTVDVRNAELKKLDKEKQDYTRIDSSLGTKARQYRQKIDEQKKLIKSAEDRIERILAEEARKAKAAPGTAAQQEELIRLTGRFDENRGKLPFPVSGGVIIEKFGRHKAADNPNLEVNQKGIVLRVGQGTPVRAVFEGNVHTITFIPGLSNTVIVRHGNYFTSYSNLETVSVKVGDKVSINQNIGKVYSGENSEYYMLLFSIYDMIKSVFVDPELWLRR